MTSIKTKRLLPCYRTLNLQITQAVVNGARFVIKRARGLVRKLLPSLRESPQQGIQAREWTPGRAIQAAGVKTAVVAQVVSAAGFYAVRVQKRILLGKCAENASNLW
ncbi:unnamed protein product [Heligmosomoides polygyrus]|uniref:Cystatin domain-containing protein n=1 Tax=Heligmosomoides polygyrus TaxID=6339 RepID=A0A183FPR6_HELPZ|nr:unnamed protein product [Heligmosomoides polygyrus]